MDIKLILTIIFGIFMIFGGVTHFLKPNIYFHFIPAFLPKKLINNLAGIIEILVGISIFIPQYRSWASLGIFIIMIGFLPLHIIDVFKEKPAIGSHTLALIRLPLQFVLILWAWFIYNN